jgi:erythromycin esterase-like protein
VKLTRERKDAITAQIQDLVALMERDRVPLTQATSADDYEWALRVALVLAQDDAYLRAFPPEWDPELLSKSPEKFPPSERWDHNAEMREVAMANNLLWVHQREQRRGKVLLFAHDLHVQTGLQLFGSPGRPLPGPWTRIRSMGHYLRAALAADMVVIGTYYRQSGSRGPSEPVAGAGGVEELLTSLSIPLVLFDLRKLPNSGLLAEWFQMSHTTRQNLFNVKPRAVFDAILYIETVSASRRSQE